MPFSKDSSIPCALEQVDDNPELENIAVKCGQCALFNMRTVVNNIDGVSEFKYGHCPLLSEVSAMVYIAQ